MLAVTGGELATIMGVVTGFIVAIVGAWTAARSDKMKQGSEKAAKEAEKAKYGVDNAAVLLGGWKDIQTATLAEVDRVRSDCERKIDDLKKEHDQDRAEWERDRQEWLKREQAWLAREAKMQAEIDELKAEVFVLLRLERQRNEE